MPDQDLAVPGTVQLITISQIDSHHAEVVLIPAPTDNVNDPLRWSKLKRILLAANLLTWTFFANAAIAWTSPAWAVWTVDLNTTFTYLNYGQAVLVMTCGLGVFFIQPWAIKYGRRGPYIFGSILILAGLVAGAFMQGINSFFVYMALAGFGSAPSYATIVTSLMDISFQHQKGRALSLYGIVLIAGNFLPPVPAGYIVDSQGWRWCIYYLIIFFGVSTLFVFFGAEETTFPRKSYTMLTQEAAPLEDKAGSTSRVMPASSHATGDSTTDTKDDSGLHSIQRGSSNSLVSDRPYSYWAKMTLFRRDADVKVSYLRLTFEVLEMALLPAPIWASAIIALATFVVSLVFTTQASFFSIPPYNFSAGQLGLMYFALLIGNAIGSYYGGNFSDWLVLRLARRNNGISEPEHRLWAYLPVPFVAAAGILLYGVGASAGLHWAVPCLGLILIGIYLNASLPIVMGYALDSYPDLSGETIQLSNFVRNVAGGAFTFAIQPWINYNGGRNTTIILAVLIFVLNLSSIPFQIWGKRIRRKTAARYVRMTGRNTYY